MSLNFSAQTDQIDVGQGASLADVVPCTIMGWVYQTGSSADARLFQKGVAAVSPNTFMYLSLGASSSFTAIQRSRATTSCLAQGVNSNFTYYGLSKWLFLSGTLDLNTTGNCTIRIGDLTHLAAEPSPYDIQRTGSGSIASDALEDAILGNKINNNAAVIGKLAWVAVWNRVLTAGEQWDQQFHPHVTSGCVGFWHLGYNGISTVPDWSGNKNNGTISLASASVQSHVPVAPFALGKQELMYAPFVPPLSMYYKRQRSL